jgi:hypothetical protein
MSNDLIGGYLTLDLNQPIKWADFRLEALLAVGFIQPRLRVQVSLFVPRD